MTDLLGKRMEFAAEAAWRAGKCTLPYFQTSIEPEWKVDGSPVTIADKEAETLLRGLVQKAFPDDGIVGEEFNEKKGTSGNRWIIDPIDGTHSFLRGVPFFGVLVAMENPDGVVLGVVYLPALDEMVYAARGEGCWWNGRRAAVSDVRELKDACICYTSASSLAAEGRANSWEALTRATRIQRGWGDCYGHVLVATGRAEGSFDPAMNSWDCGPLLPILEEAGGTFTDWEGRATIYGKNAFSTNGHLFDAVLSCLNC